MFAPKIRLAAKLSPFIAWIISGLSIYSLFFIIGDFNAIKARPILIQGNLIKLRIGIRWYLEIDKNQIDQIIFKPSFKETPEKRLKMELFTQHNVLIHLKKPVLASTYYGIKKKTACLSLFIDDLDGFRTLFQEVEQ